MFKVNNELSIVKSRYSTGKEFDTIQEAKVYVLREKIKTEKYPKRLKKYKFLLKQISQEFPELLV